MRRWAFRGFLLASTLEGVSAVFLLFQIPSMERNSWLFGFSLARLLFGASYSLLIVFLAWLSYKALCDQQWLSETNMWIEERLAVADRFLASVCTAFLFFMLGLFSLILFESSFISPKSFLAVVFARARPIVIWGTLVSLQAPIALLVGYSNKRLFRQLNRDLISRTSAPFLILLATLSHWAILRFGIPVFTRIPDWAWPFLTRYELRYCFLIPLLALSIIVVRVVVSNPSRTIRNLILLGFLAYTLQIGFGFIEGRGYKSIRLRLIKIGGHSDYARIATHESTTYASLQSYEENYWSEGFLGTKPPGVLFFHLLMRDLSNSINPESTYDGRYQRLTLFEAHFFPLLSLLVLLVMYKMGKLFFKEHEAVLPLIFYIVSPNVILMTWAMDQILYPLLFMLGVYLTIYISQKRSLWLTTILGVLFYLAVYFSFALLILIPLSILVVMFEYDFRSKTKSAVDTLRTLLGIAVGFSACYLIFKFQFHYDMLTRYENAMGLHRLIKGFQPGINQSLKALAVNTVEFATWIGFPFASFVLLQAFETLAAYWARRPKQLDRLMMAALISYLVLNLFGQTNGEVGRLWLFSVPLLSIFAFDTVRRLYVRREWLYYLIVLLQVLTTYFLFKYQY